MKKHSALLIFSVLSISSLVFSCKKEKSGCENGNLCFSLNGNEITLPDAKRKALPNNYFRIFWEEGDTTNYKSFKMDVFGTAVGEYTFKANAGTFGDAGLQYFVNDNGTSTTYNVTAGTLDLKLINGTRWNGTFSGTVNDGTNSLELKNGHFIDVDLE